MKTLQQFLIEALSDEYDERFAFSETTSYDSKDAKRINDIVSKSMGNVNKQISLATTMAKLIKDKLKAIRRFNAAKDILKIDHAVTKIFLDRAIELGATANGAAPVQKIPDVKTKPTFVYDPELAEKLWARFLDEAVPYMVQRRDGYGFVSNRLGERRTPAFLRKANANDYLHFAMKAIEHSLNQTPGSYVYFGSRKLRYQHQYKNNKGEAYDRSEYLKNEKTYSVSMRAPALYELQPLKKEFDFGDAKVNPKNPVHLLFVGEFEAEQAAAKTQKNETALKILKNKDTKKPLSSDTIKILNDIFADKETVTVPDSEKTRSVKAAFAYKMPPSIGRFITYTTQLGIDSYPFPIIQVLMKRMFPKLTRHIDKLLDKGPQTNINYYDDKQKDIVQLMINYAKLADYYKFGGAKIDELSNDAIAI